LDQAKTRVAENFKRNDAIEEGEFGITSVLNLYGVYGTRNMLELVHPQSLANLLRVLSPFVRDRRERMGDATIEVNHCIGGGYLLRNHFFEVPEIATCPLKLFAIFKPTTYNRQVGMNFFADYIYDDILSLSRVDQEFNLFKEFAIEGRDEQGLRIKKSYSLEDVMNSKNSFFTELREGVERKQKLSLTLWLRIKNLNKLGSYTETSMNPLSQGMRTLVVNDEDFIYVKTTKVYILHVIEQKEKLSFVSFSHAPLCALQEGIFQSREAAESYASFYIKHTQSPTEKS